MDMKEHLAGRHLNPSHYQMHWDGETACFYLFNLSGEFCGYQQYRPGASKTHKNSPKKGRYYTYLKDGSLGVWGLETFNFRKDLLFLTEGVFDACRLHNLGLPAVAVLANDPKRTRFWLRTLNRRTVAVCDNDEAGRRLANSCDTALFCAAGKDLGDMTENEVKDLLKEYLYATA